MKQITLLLTLISLTFSPVFAATTKSANSSQTDESARIREVENGLSQLVRVEGESLWTIEERMKHYNIRGMSVAVVDDYEIKWAKGYGVTEQGGTKPVTTKTTFQSASISKSVNALGIMKLAEEGKLDLTADVNTLLKSWKFPYDEKSGKEKINMMNLLSHTAGLTTSGFGGYARSGNLPSLIQILDGKNPANSGAVRSFRPPNAGYQYSGGGTVMTQLILKDITNMSYQDYMAKTVLGPLGMSDSFYDVTADRKARMAIAHRRDGNKLKNSYNYYPEQAPAGLWTTPTDIAKFFIEVQKANEGKSKRLSQKSAALMLKPFLKGNNSALGFFIEDRKGTKYFQHGGSNEGFKSQYYASFEGGKGVVVMVNSDSYDIIPEVIRSVATTYQWPNFYDPTVRKVVPVSADELKPLAGVYKFETGNKLRVIAEGDKLFLGTRFGNRFPLYPESKTNFFLRIQNEQLHFKSDGGVRSFDFVRGSNTSKAIRQKPSLPFAMLDVIKEKGVDAGLDWFQKSKDDPKYDNVDVFDLNEVGYVMFKASRVSDAIKVFRFNLKNYPDSNKAPNRLTENNVNNTGYDYLRNKKVKDAIEIFRLNTELFPKSFNTYDSLGEGLLADKQYKAALAAYEKSVEMNPNSFGGKMAIFKIKAILKKQQETK